MPSQTEPNSGIKYGWDFGEQYHTEMDENLLRLGRFGFHLCATSTVSSPPGSPTVGQTHIVGASPSGAWSGWQHRVVVWDGAAWQSATPRNGWLCWDRGAGRLRVFEAGAWLTGVAIT